jgi:hypothetical protein
MYPNRTLVALFLPLYAATFKILALTRVKLLAHITAAQKSQILANPLVLAKNRSKRSVL